MSLRPAGPDDAAGIAALEVACFPARPWHAAQVGAELGRAGATAVVAPGRGYALGWALAGEGELVRIGVHPDARRAGLGARLLAAFLAAQQAAGAAATWLEVRADNAAAQALYRRAGFSQRGRRPGYYGDGCDAVVMAVEGAP